MGRETTGAMGAHVPRQVESPHTFLTPLAAPRLICCCDFLAGNASPDSGSRNTPEDRQCQQLPVPAWSRAVAEGPPAPVGCWLLGPACERLLQVNKKSLNVSEGSCSSPPPPLFPVLPSPPLPCKQQSCFPVPFSTGPAPQDTPGRDIYKLFFPPFLTYLSIYLFFLSLFSSTHRLSPCHTPPPATPSPRHHPKLSAG